MGGFQEFNGVYTIAGAPNGRPQYRNSSGQLLLHNNACGEWQLLQQADGEIIYYVEDDRNAPPTSGWLPVQVAHAPVPCVLAVGVQHRSPSPAQTSSRQTCSDLILSNLS